MNYEIDSIKREINSLKWQKADNDKVDRLETAITFLKQRIMDLANENGWLNERIVRLEIEKIEREKT